ncbi:uncharacterized protein LOC129741775 [Uranotaenia lowii]|uniref:uncharacterized protein LOC129741775 n=1 Tax=Uranotaenia lowii TaxID=190385 RepID=UPI00247B150A|nr:uncharacterized protein LOC129741775 [Uranotaenia lowii]
MPIGADAIKSKARLLKRNSILTSFTVICRFVENYEEVNDAAEVSSRLERLEKLWDDFHDTQTEIEINDESTETADQHFKARVEFETQFYKNGSELHKLVDTFERTVKVLKQLGEPTEQWDTLLIHLLTHRLDKKTHRDWEEFCADKDDETTDMLISFLHRKVNVLQAVIEAGNDDVTITKKPQKTVRVGSHGAFQQPPTYKCIACPETHPLFRCPAFGQLAAEDRELLLRKHALCCNCFRKNHIAAECKSTGRCRACGERHHTLVCLKKPSTGPSRGIAESSSYRPRPPPNHNSSQATVAVSSEPVSLPAVSHTDTRVLLATAVVLLVTENGVEIPVRALLDSGSECHFATERLRQLLNLRRERVNLPILGIGQTNTHVRSKIRAKLRSRICNFEAAIEMLVLPKVTMDLPGVSLSPNNWNIPPSIQLADPSFHDSNPVDLIIGAEIFFHVFAVPGQISLGEGLPLLINSRLGWVVSGRATKSTTTSPRLCSVARVQNLEKTIARFWEIEEGGFENRYSVEEAECERHYLQHVSRQADGRYLVKLPTKPDVLAKLGDSKTAAVRRMHQIERRFSNDPVLAAEYRKFMDEYESLGHMVQVNDDIDPNVPNYYLPHHPVVKSSSSTTKVRVVFDASNKTPGGPSLNDALLVGPTVQSDLRSIVMRSRTHPIILICDVEKMYRQISVAAEDLPLQRIVWRKFSDQPLRTYQLTTVTYGTAAAPFLATRTLKQLALDEGSEFPLAAQAVEVDCYVDDLITGAKTTVVARELITQLIALLERGKMNLRKFASNNQSILKNIPPENLAVLPTIDFDRDDTIKTLGLVWDYKADCFLFKIPTYTTQEKPLTKRSVLSRIAQLYDPLGLVGPVITSAKCFMQELWCLESESGKPWGWDDPLPQQVQERWVNYEKQLPNLNQLKIERFVLINHPKSVQIHCFSDASEVAYGCCLYIRSENSKGKVKISLLSSRSRVAPLRKKSIPRLELCGALLSSELHAKVESSLKLSAQTFFWTDSSIVLQWLNASPGTWHTFVANRVAKVQQLTKNCRWNHVSGVENPADLISRGISPAAIIENELWWKGPRWLAQPESSWPINIPIEISDDTSLERKVTVATAALQPESDEFLDRYLSHFSEFHTMLRCTAIVRRFLRHLRCRKASVDSGPLSCTEIRSAELRIVSLVQKQIFPSEFTNLTSDKPVHRSSPLLWLKPFIRPSESVIRVGGRLQHSCEPDDAKHQLILPSKHRFTQLLLESFHLRLLHAGPQLLLNVVRLRYWPLGGRNFARKIVHRCVTCVKAKPNFIQQPMGDLPKARVTESKPFTSSGVDFFGPVWIKPAHRKAAPVKAYVAVFICFVTRAIHLELVADLSTAKFIQALRRFISRRGNCRDIFSDNGTNFVGARNELKELNRWKADKTHNDLIAKECVHNGIEWHFIPPRAPHFGGLWESAVKSCKHHLIRVLGTSALAYDDIVTLLCQIEACVNSRPILPLKDDPLDLEPLTPGHFLVGCSLKEIPEEDYTNIPQNRLKMWQLIQQLKQRFWARWHTEYLNHLQMRTRWNKAPTKLRVGQLVVLREDNVAQMNWPTGRITELHPGPDGAVRVVSLRTVSGVCKRAVNRIALLPVTDNIDEQQNDQPQVTESTPEISSRAEMGFQGVGE